MIAGQRTKMTWWTLVLVTLDFSWITSPQSLRVCERGFSAQKRIKSDTRASLHSDTVEDLIRISVEGTSLEDLDAKENVGKWFSQGQRSRRPNFKSWPSEGHVTAMEDRP
nr:zinc finger protein 862-like [Misgurnus anguillicaudatus]